MEKKLELSFGVACIRFFGLREGQSLQSFSQEVKLLTLEDREEITKYFTDNGIAIKNLQD